MVELFRRVEGKGLDINITNVTITVIMTMVLLQIFSSIFGKALGFELFTGPSILVLAVVSLAGVSVALTKKMLQGQPLTKKDVFSTLLITGIALLLLFYLRDFVPELFSESVLELQSIMGF